jgi:glycosyltransferase involved in cell wall biosynthesis
MAGKVILKKRRGVDADAAQRLSIMKTTIWITWENQVRNKTMASLLGVQFYPFVCNGNRVKRYLICTFKTLLTLMRGNPRIVFAQNPSLILNYILLIARIFFRYKLVSDAHYAGVIAFNGNSLIQRALDLCNRLVDLVIVTNTEHLAYIHNIGGKAIVCEDPLPDIGQYYADENISEKTVFYICSYDIDEPYDAAFEAARLLSKEDFKFFVTGNYKKANLVPSDYPHITFLGYLPKAEYYTKLFQTNIVLDLTDNENCLVCGAYEAMTAERPLVVSDTICLKNYFTKGTVFTKNDKNSIADAIRQAYRNRSTLKKEIADWKQSIYAHQDARVSDIYRVLEIPKDK